MNVLAVLMQTSAGQSGGGMGGMLIMLVAIFAIMYFFMIRPQNKKQKELNNFRKSLQVNQRVMTVGGIYGIVKEINEDHLVLEIATGVRVKIDKNSVFADSTQAKK